MKRILIFIVAIATLSCCDRWKQQPAETNDSTAVDSTAVTEKPEPVYVPIAHRVGDSIAAAHGPNFYNKLVQEDIIKDLKKYVNSFRGKHCPMIEELPFTFNDITQDGRGHIAAFKYDVKATEYRQYEMQLAVRVTRDDGKTLVKGSKYRVVGTVKGLIYVDPYFLPRDEHSRRDIISYGAIEVSNAEITPYK